MKIRMQIMMILRTRIMRMSPASDARSRNTNSRNSGVEKAVSEKRRTKKEKPNSAAAAAAVAMFVVEPVVVAELCDDHLHELNRGHGHDHHHHRLHRLDPRIEYHDKYRNQRGTNQNDGCS